MDTLLNYFNWAASLLLLLLFCLVKESYAAKIPLNTSRSIAEHEETSKVVMALSIDLRSCKCLRFDQECELVIAKSNLIEIQCPENHHFCCNENQKPRSSDKTSIVAHSTESSTTKSEMDTTTQAIPVQINPSLRPKNSSLSDESTNNTSDDSKIVLLQQVRMTSVQEFADQTIPSVNPIEDDNLQPQTKCRCKPRHNCSDKHVDYSFGFHCSYDKVRCCEPMELIWQEMDEQSGGRLVILNAHTSNTNHHQNSDDGSNTDETIDIVSTSFDNANDEQPNCLCLPATQCKIKRINEIARRRDLACPFNYVQCCGSSINNNPDYIETDKNRANYDIIPSEDQYIEGRGMTTNQAHGQSSFRQKPVQLPQLIVPAEFTSTSTTTSTLPPPNLPSYYQQNQAIRDETGKVYYHKIIRPIQQSQPYFRGQIIRLPSSSTYQQSPYYISNTNNHNHLLYNKNNDYYQKYILPGHERKESSAPEPAETQSLSSSIGPDDSAESSSLFRAISRSGISEIKHYSPSPRSAASPSTTGTFLDKLVDIFTG